MVSKKVVSKSKSFKAWSFKQWFKGNWITIKEGLKIGVPALIGWLATGNPALTAIITIAGKLLIDSGEYYFKSY